MKIVFISLFRKGQGGGEGRVAHELAEQFNKVHDTVMICPGEETGLYQDENGLKTFGVRSAGTGEFDMPALTGRTVRYIFDFLDVYQPDVIHAHEPALLGLVGQVWAKMNLVPFVHTSHVLPDKILNFGAKDILDLKFLQTSFSETITRRVLMDFYRNCDAIIALNQAAVDAFRKFGYRERLFIIPNGRNLEKYSSCEFADIQTRPHNLSFIGYISERKNQEYLIQAMKHLPADVRLVLLGRPLDREYGLELKEICQKYDLNVDFAGQVPHEVIPGYLAESHLFTSASKMEVQSLVVIEALASGTPVIGLENETTSELIDDQVGKLLPMDTPPESYASAVEEILSLPPDQYRSLCSRARNSVRHLDWKQIVDRTVDAYQELIEGSPTISETESDTLLHLISSLPEGEVRDILINQIIQLEKNPGLISRFVERLALTQKWQALQRVKGSTWMLAGATILVSLVGYLFNKNRPRQQD